MKARGNTMVRYALALLVAFAVIGSAGWAAAQQVGAVPTGVTGKVEFRPGPNDKFQPLKVGVAVYEGADIRSYANSSAELRLADGSTLTIAENSRFVVTKLESQGNQVKTAFFHLAIGKLKASVTKLAATLVSTQQRRFAISTPTAVAAVRGTDLITQVDSAGNTVAVVKNGSATFTFNGVTYNVPPGGAIVIPRAQPGQPTPQPVVIQNAGNPTQQERQALAGQPGAPAALAKVETLNSVNPAAATSNPVTVAEQSSYAATVTNDAPVVVTSTAAVMNVVVTSVPTAPAAQGGGQAATMVITPIADKPVQTVSPIK